MTPTSTLAIFQQRFAFTQDRLLTPDEFLHAANERGRAITADQLRNLHETGWLTPMYYIDDESDTALTVAVPPDRVDGVNAVGDAVTAAHEGRLREGGDVAVAAAPHNPPRSERVRSRWLYSQWQLLDLRHTSTNITAPLPAWAQPRIALAHARTLALSYAAWWALPGIVDTVRLLGGTESYEAWRTAAAGADATAVLDAAGWTASDVRSHAEQLLIDAHTDDPNRDWLPLVRHMRPQWWRRLRGLARDALERRIAAEVLLAVYEQLVTKTGGEELPDLGNAMGWHALHDRLLGPELDRTPLDEALVDAGLSPHPRVVLLVEGESEAIAARLLLAELASETSDWVRVHSLGGATTDPKMLARFAVAPAIARRAAPSDDAWALARPPTLLVIHVDPEGRWSTREKAASEREHIIDALDQEVRAQGVVAARDDLAWFVHIDRAGPGGFEYANFTDEELAVAAAAVSDVAANIGVEQLAVRFADGRAARSGINGVLGALRIAKPQLAAALAPRLVAQLPEEIERGATTPIIRAVLKAIESATSIPRGHIVLRGRCSKNLGQQHLSAPEQR